MAEFEPAFRRLLIIEGGYSDDSHDHGGPTNFGLSSRWLQSVGLEMPRTVEQAARIYKKYWWDDQWFSKIVPQEVASKCFDVAVNTCSPPEFVVAAHILQRALRACGFMVADDGKAGTKTIAAANLAPVNPLLAALRSEHAAYYRILIAGNPDAYSRYRNGWITRAYRR
jgi:lysozyme family protein